MRMGALLAQRSLLKCPRFMIEYKLANDSPALLWNLQIGYFD